MAGCSRVSSLSYRRRSVGKGRVGSSTDVFKHEAVPRPWTAKAGRVRTLFPQVWNQALSEAHRRARPKTDLRTRRP